VTKFNLQQIDKSLLNEHIYLTSQDYCFFFGDYAGRQGYAISTMNSLMQNFKKPASRKNKQEWYYKEKAIDGIADLLLSTQRWEKLRACTWVPMPSSKTHSDPEYDNRLLQVLLKIKNKENDLDIRELLKIKSSRPAAHEPNSKRLSIEEHLNNMIFDDSKKNPTPKSIVIFDDVITTGASFKAAQNILRQNYSSIPIGGVFIARSMRDFTKTSK
jgi:predicted amidophosphoribosyltransferase